MKELVNAKDIQEVGPFDFAWNLYPNLIIVLLVLVSVGILVPFLGFIACLKRCCSDKYDPYDKKNDITKRKVYTGVLSFFVFAFLIGIIVLFSSNHIAFVSVQNSDTIIQNDLKLAQTFKVDQFKRLVEKAKLEIPVLTDDFITIYENMLDELIKEETSTSTTIDLKQKIDNQKVSIIQEVREVFSRELNIYQKDFNKFTAKIGQKFIKSVS
jgi:hypothetical protein